jgi:methanogenic corrinoid protein MtbC1
MWQERGNLMEGLVRIADNLYRGLDAVIEEALRRQYATEGKLWDRYGDEGMEKSLRDSRYNMSYLLAALRAGDPAILADYLSWLIGLFDSLGFGPGRALTTFSFLGATAAASVDSSDAETLLAFIDTAIDLARTPANEAEPAMAAPRASAYLNHILGERRQAAVDYIMGLHAEGVSLKDIYLSVFGPVQRELGRLWQTRKIGVAQEHYGTAITQLAMARLYPSLFTGERKSRRMAAAGVGGELHELGIRMVADFFEMDGWDSRYYGANLPPAELAKAVAADKPDLLCLSATMPWHVEDMKATISEIRRVPRLASLPILAGGRPFVVSPELWRSVGADGTAATAQGALELAGKLVERVA